jgi:Fe-S oxidoreductase
MSEPMPPVSDHRRAYAYCASCPKLCRFSCPVSESERRETVTPWGKMNVGHQLATESRPLDASAVDAAYACSGCMRCTSHCRHGTDVATALVAVRSKAAHDGLLPEPIQKLRTRFQTHGSPFASPLPQLSKSAGAVTGGAYFPGCTALAKEPAMVGQALRSAQKVGAHLSLSPAAGHCCAYPLYAAGLLEEFAQHAKRFVEQTSGPLTVGDPGCAFTFMKLYPQVGVPSPADRLWVDVVADRLRNGVDGAPVEQSLGWHDPCHLGRGLGRYEAPRAILQAALGGASFAEAAESRQDAGCSGAGGALPRTHSATAKDIGARQAQAIGAKTVVTACPAARRWFEKSGASAISLETVLAKFLQVE